MVARHFYRSVPEDPVTEVPTVLRWGYTLQEKAEEGEAPMIEIVVDDPDMTLEFVGHRRWVVYEDDSEDDNEVIYSGLTQSVKIAHKGGDVTNPMGRVWTITIADLNTLWTYRVMTGSDSQFAEQTDVERMQQLVDSEEMGYFDDLTLLSSANPVTMDKANGRGQTPAQIADSCAQQSGKNWYIYSTGSIAGGSDIGVWYGKSVSDYTSPLSLSNDPADIDAQAVNDASATTYPIGADTELGKDYARQYSGAYGEFQGGAKYVVDDDTLALITLGGRDTTHPAPEIKTRERMKRRLLRVLSDHSQPDDVIRTTITLPGNKVSQVRAGMRISFKATHLPGYELESYLRIMSCSPRPIGRKGPYDMYAVALEMQGPGTSAAPITLTACNNLPTRGALSDPSEVEVRPNQVYTFRVTQSQYENDAYTQNFQIESTEIPGEHYVFDSPPDTPIGPPFEVVGTFTTGPADGGFFQFSCSTNGYTTGGPTFIDDCWTLEIWRGIVDPDA